MWFQGSTQEALEECKEKGALLVVFYITDNEESKRITDLWCNDTMRNACKDLKILSITIDAESVNGKQFGQVYPIFCVPSIFMLNGHTPLEVILTFDKITAEHIIEKLNKAYELHETYGKDGAPPNTATSAIAPTTTAATTVTTTVTTSGNSQSNAEPTTSTVTGDKVAVSAAVVEKPVVVSDINTVENSTATAGTSKSSEPATEPVPTKDTEEATTTPPKENDTPKIIQQITAPVVKPAITAPKSKKAIPLADTPRSGPVIALPDSASVSAASISLAGSSAAARELPTNAEGSKAEASGVADNGVDTEVMSTKASPKGDGQEVIERAKEMVKMQQDKKVEEDKKRNKKDELERRQVGKDMAEFRERQKVDQLKEDAASWKKDKREDAIAREKIMAQISQDRADRASRYNNDKATKISMIEEKNKLKAKAKEDFRASLDEDRMKSAVIQFRLIDGSTVKQTFSSAQKFSDVVEFITKNVGNNKLRLTTNFPRKEFTAEDNSKSLRDLGLAPQSTINTVPAGRPANVISSNSGYNFLSILLSPFSYMWSWIRYLFYPATPPSPPQAKPSTPSAPQPNQSSTIYPESSASSNKSMLGGLEKSRFGNITTFKSKVTDDTDKATDNGNSSQQL